jgi:hypothetical protein
LNDSRQRAAKERLTMSKDSAAAPLHGVVLPRRWDDMQQSEQKSCYWAAIPNDPDNILDGMEYEIVYVYFDGKWSVMRPGESQRESLSAFRFLCPIDSFEIKEA